MSGLSARVSSCGGEGSLLGRGGEAFGGGAAFLVAFFALWKMGASFLTSSSGADESPLLSESDMVAVVRKWLCGNANRIAKRAETWWCLTRSERATSTGGTKGKDRKVERRRSTVKTDCLLLGKTYTDFIAYGSSHGTYETLLASLQCSQ